MLCYIPNSSIKANELSKMMNTCIMGKTAQLFTTVASFAERLREQLDARTVAVVHAPSEKDLIDLYFIQHLLSKVLLILLLPDTKPDTIAMGHRLYPSFMCSADIQMSDLIAILKNIIDNGYVPEPDIQFRNSFESISPSNFPGFKSYSWIYAAA